MGLERRMERKSKLKMVPNKMVDLFMEIHEPHHHNMLGVDFLGSAIYVDRGQAARLGYELKKLVLVRLLKK